MIVLTEDIGCHTVLATTCDDSVGEVFDKIARNLPPSVCRGIRSGATIEKIALQQNTYGANINYHDSYETFDFSFSGLKTATLAALSSDCSESSIAGVMKNFHDLVEKILISKLVNCIELCKGSGIKINKLVLGGGVSANKIIRTAFKNLGGINGLDTITAQTKMGTDNATMIGFSSILRLQVVKPLKLQYTIPDFPLGYLKDDDQYLLQYAH